MHNRRRRRRRAGRAALSARLLRAVDIFVPSPRDGTSRAIARDGVTRWRGARGLTRAKSCFDLDAAEDA